jgi:parallel beta-helix repeat protein
MNIKNVGKILAVGIIFLFLAGVSPSIGITTNERPIIQITSGNTFYVGGIGLNNYTKIQDAIYNATDGDTVFVYDDSSPYYENVVVNKSINLIGENKKTTVIDGGDSGAVARINSWVNISGFTIQNGDTGISLGVSSEHSTIKGNIISNNKNYGIYLRGSSYITIRDNIISNNKDGINLKDFQIFGNVIDSSRNVIIRNNFLDNIRNANFDLLPEGLFLYTPRFNLWLLNYWNKPRLLPQFIYGKLYINPEKNFFIPWVQIDWRPAFEPYDI